MMFVYILFSESTKKFYTGQTRNVESRISRHNSKRVPSTIRGIPWKLVWQRQVMSSSEAVQLERRIKGRGAKRFLDNEST